MYTKQFTSISNTQQIKINDYSTRQLLSHITCLLITRPNLETNHYHLRKLTGITYTNAGPTLVSQSNK